MHYLGSFKYTEMQWLLPKLYEGFSLTDYHVEPGTILYTSINPDSEDVNLKLYKEGNKIYWPKLTRATKIPSTARCFVNKGGIFIAFELDYWMPHYHIWPDRLINTQYVFSKRSIYFFHGSFLKFIKLSSMMA